MLAFYVKYHAKFLTALAAPVGLIAAALSDGEVTSSEGSKIGGAFGVALLVYLFPNANAGDKPASKATLQAQIDALQAQVKGLGG